MVGLALGTILVALLGCGHSPTELTGSVDFQTVLKDSLPGDMGQLPGEATVRDAASWQKIWMDLHHLNAPPVPAIDFSREMVILVVGPGCNGKVEITAIDRERGDLAVRAEAKSCGNALCILADFAVHVVRLPRFDGPVRFMVKRDDVLC